MDVELNMAGSPKMTGVSLAVTRPAAYGYRPPVVRLLELTRFAELVPILTRTRIGLYGMSRTVLMASEVALSPLSHKTASQTNKYLFEAHSDEQHFNAAWPGGKHAAPRPVPQKAN